MTHNHLLLGCAFRKISFAVLILIHSIFTRNNHIINLTNPLLIESLTKSELKPLFPNNPDVFIELKIKNAQEIHCTTD